MQPDAPMGLEAEMLVRIDKMRDELGEMEALLARIIIEKGDDARVPHTSSAVVYSAPVEIVSRATAQHAVMVPRGAFCCDVGSDEP